MFNQFTSHLSYFLINYTMPSATACPQTKDFDMQIFITVHYELSLISVLSFPFNRKTLRKVSLDSHIFRYFFFLVILCYLISVLYDQRTSPLSYICFENTDILHTQIHAQFLCLPWILKNISLNILLCSPLTISSEDYWTLCSTWCLSFMLQLFLKNVKILANPFVFIKRNRVISTECWQVSSKLMRW